MLTFGSFCTPIQKKLFYAMLRNATDLGWVGMLTFGSFCTPIQKKLFYATLRNATDLGWVGRLTFGSFCTPTQKKLFYAVLRNATDLGWVGRLTFVSICAPIQKELFYATLHNATRAIVRTHVFVYAASAKALRAVGTSVCCCLKVCCLIVDAGWCGRLVTAGHVQFPFCLRKKRTNV